MPEIDETEQLSAALVAVLIIGVGGPVLGLVGLLERPGRIGSHRPRMGTILSMLMVLTAAGLALSGQPLIIWSSLAVLAAADLLSRGLNRFTSLVVNLGRRVVTARRLHAALVLVGAPIVAFGLGWHINSSTQVPELDLFKNEVSEPLSETRPTNRYAATDRGRFISVYTAVPTIDTPTSAELKRHEDRIQQSGVLRILAVGQPDLTTNCHGWVFLGSGYCLLGKDVPGILEDNGYEKVAQPRQGDLVVYGNDPANILHTGLVRFVDDGIILIESKWGNLGRYLHEPGRQPYSQDWTYYRSPRHGHLLYGDWGQPSPNIAFTSSGADVQP
jgi:hypothetical protein